MERTSARPWSGGAVVDGGAIRQALLRCFDEQIDELEPDEGYKRDQRAALVETLDRFVALLADESRAITVG
jgi:hypothetical protein